MAWTMRSKLTWMMLLSIGCYDEPTPPADTDTDATGGTVAATADGPATNSNTNATTGPTSDTNPPTTSADDTVSGPTTDDPTTDGSDSGDTGEVVCTDAVCYEDQLVLAAGTEPTDIVIADIDDDGNLDIVTANRGSDNFSVHLGDGAGGFDLPAFFPVGAGPVTLAIASYNPDVDGLLDVVTGDQDGRTITTLFNTGDGFLFDAASPTTLDIGQQADAAPLAAEVGVLTPDSLNAGCVMALDSDQLLIMYGDGNGFSSDLDALPCTYGCDWVAAGNLTQDQYVDMLASNSTGLSGELTTLSLPFNVSTSDYGFQVPPTTVQLRDVDGDQRPDIVAANGPDGSVTVALGNGMGAFGPPTLTPAGSSPRAVDVGDADDDGNPDVIVVDTTDDTASVLLGDGAGGLAAPLSFAVGAEPWAVAVADLDGDGRADIVTANRSDGSISVLLSELPG